MTPIEQLLAQVHWVAGEPQPAGDLPYATHSGVLEIGGARLRCYRLSDGRAIFDAEDMRAFFGDALDAPTTPHTAGKS